MPKISDLRDGDTVLHFFHCPGCGENHAPTNKWSFNGDYEKPTFSPSILVTSGHYSPHHKGGGCWCNWNKTHPGEPQPFKCTRCHSFVTDGKIQFLSDCTHELAGQTVDIPEWEE